MMIHLVLPHSGNHEGDMRLAHDLEFHGRVSGSVTVPPGRRLRFHGQIHGDLIVQKNAQASIYGTISGAVVNDGAEVNILGRAGSVRDTGDRSTILNDRPVTTGLPRDVVALDGAQPLHRPEAELPAPAPITAMAKPIRARRRPR